MKNFLLTVRDILLILFLTLFSMIVSGLWLPAWEINAFMLPLHYLLAPAIQLAIFIPGFHFLKKRLFHDSYDTISWPPRMRRHYFLYALLLLFLCYTGAFLSGLTVSVPMIDPYLVAQNAASLPGAFIVAPFIEETVFRGVILTQTARRFGLTAGMIVSSVLFGAAHLMNGSLGLLSAIQLILGGTLMGLLLSVLYVKEGSIWANVTVHALYNAILSLLPISTLEMSDWPIQLILNQRNPLLTGGEYGIDCSIINLIAYMTVTIVLIIAMHRHQTTLKDAWRKMQNRRSYASQNK